MTETEPSIEIKEPFEVKESSPIDPWSMITDVKGDGIPYSWSEIQEEMNVKGINALESVFDWDTENTAHFDTITCFYLACSYFTKLEDLSAEANKIKARVENKAKKIIREDRKKKPNLLNMA